MAVQLPPERQDDAPGSLPLLPILILFLSLAIILALVLTTGQTRPAERVADAATEPVEALAVTAEATEFVAEFVVPLTSTPLPTFTPTSTITPTPEPTNTPEPATATPVPPTVDPNAPTPTRVVLGGFASADATAEAATDATAEAADATAEAADATVEPVSFESGEAMYAWACASCHGADANGVPDFGPGLRMSTLVVTGDKAGIIRLFNEPAPPVNSEETFVHPYRAGYPELTDEQLGEVVDHLFELVGVQPLSVN